MAENKNTAWDELFELINNPNAEFAAQQLVLKAAKS